MVAEAASLEKELRVANKTIERLKAIAIELKVAQKKNERIVDLIKTYESDAEASPEELVLAIKQLFHDGTSAPSPPSSASSLPALRTDAGSQTESSTSPPSVQVLQSQEIGVGTPRTAVTKRLTWSKFESRLELESLPDRSPLTVITNTPIRGSPEGRTSSIHPPTTGEQSSGNNRLVEKLKLEASRFKEEALGARENLRVFAEVKERELEELRQRLEEAQRRLNLVQKKSRDDEDSIAFLESELNLKKAALDRAELLTRDLQTQNEVLVEFKASVERRAASKGSAQLGRQDMEQIYLEPILPENLAVEDPKIASFPSEASFSEQVDQSPDFRDIGPAAREDKKNDSTSLISEGDVAVSQDQAESPAIKFGITGNPMIVDLTLESPTDKTTLHSDTRTSSDQSLSTVLAERESELRKLETEKQQTVSMLRAKDLMIEKLHRRLKSMATNETLDGAISRMATREAKLEREVAKLKSKLEVIEREREELKEKMTGEIINNRDWLYLRQMLPKFLQHFQKGETEMARALLPVVCSILRLSNDECVAILKSLSIPAPRANI